MKYLEDFFKIYNDYASVDAYYSLSYEGRNRTLVLKFYDTLADILDSNPSEESILKSLKSLFTELSQYKKDKSTKIQISSNEVNIKNILLFDLNDTLKLFYKAARSYHVYRQELEKNNLIELYIKNVENDYRRSFVDSWHVPTREQIYTLIGSDNAMPRTKSMLKQSLMEFNNAISHIHAALVMNNEEIVINNLKRAQGHFHRACLDFYKAIVKDLAFLSKVSGFESDIIEVRLKEYQSIGHDHINREAVIEWYADLVDKLLGKGSYTNGT